MVELIDRRYKHPASLYDWTNPSRKNNYIIWMFWAKKCKKMAG